MSFGSSRSFCLRGLLVRNDANVEQGPLCWEDCSNALRPVILFHNPRFAWTSVQCQLALETMLFGDSGSEIDECLLVADFGCDDAAVC